MDIAKRLEPYFKIALKETDNSECARRKYAAMIVYDWYGDIGSEGTEWNPWHLNANARVSKQCRGNLCIRERLSTPHGQNVERGAEIHAEAAVLIKAGQRKMHSYFILVGKDAKTGNELLGKECLPCHVCALMIKWAGYEFLFHKDIAGRIVALSIDDIIEYREEEIEALLYDG
jgi:deoxycytidylate deaminase